MFVIAPVCPAEGRIRPSGSTTPKNLMSIVVTLLWILVSWTMYTPSRVGVTVATCVSEFVIVGGALSGPGHETIVHCHVVLGVFPPASVIVTTLPVTNPMTD